MDNARFSPASALYHGIPGVTAQPLAVTERRGPSLTKLLGMRYAQFSCRKIGERTAICISHAQGHLSGISRKLPEGRVSVAAVAIDLCCGLPVDLRNRCLGPKNLTFLTQHLSGMSGRALPEHFTTAPFHAYVARRFNGIMVQGSRHPPGGTAIVKHHYRDKTVQRPGYPKISWSDDLMVTCRAPSARGADLKLRSSNPNGYWPKSSRASEKNFRWFW